MFDYPVEVIPDIVRVLKWIEANPRGKWTDMGDAYLLYQRWRDFIRGDSKLGYGSLLDDNGTMHTVSGLSSFGRLFLMRYGRTPEAETGEPPGDSQSDAEQRHSDHVAATDKITQAIALRMKHPDWTAKRIADEVGCTPANLSQNKKWQLVERAGRDAANTSAHREGKDHRSKDRGGKHRGHDMDQYADDAASETSTRLATGPKCASCSDPAGMDDTGELLMHEGKPRCRECWKELTGRPRDPRP